jgi:hypothetical protein
MGPKDQPKHVDTVPIDEDAPGPPISVPDSGDHGEGGKLKMIVQIVKKCLGVKDIAAMFVRSLFRNMSGRTHQFINDIRTSGVFHYRLLSLNPSLIWSIGIISIDRTYSLR